MKIAADTGRVTLKSGFVFDATLTQIDFEAQKLHDPARVRNPGTPWFYHPFVAEHIEGHPLILNVCFYRNVLVSFDLAINLYPEGATWTDNSYAVEEQAQKLHILLVEEWFSAPHERTRVHSVPKKYSALSKALSYKFAWGTAWCGYDERSSGTSIVVRYSKNDEWARQEPEQQWRPPEF